jgi:hypothetical protein
MTLVDEIFEDHSPVNAPANDTGVTWEFAFTVTEAMREDARLRNPRKWKLSRRHEKIGEQILLGKISRGKL